MRHDSLGRVAGDLIGYVQFFRDAPDSARPDTQGLRLQLIQMFDRFSASPTAQSLDPSELDAARFALAAWADETILMSTWVGRNEWQNELLQANLFGTNKGGDEFYERLAALPANFQQAREVFFLCLVNGFDGKLVGDVGARRDLMRELYETLRVAGLASDAATERHLAEPAYNLAIEIESGSGRKLLPVLGAWMGATAIGCALLYLALWLMAGSVEIPPEI